MEHRVDDIVVVVVCADTTSVDGGVMIMGECRRDAATRSHHFS